MIVMGDDDMRTMMALCPEKFSVFDVYRFSSHGVSSPTSS